MHHVNTSQTQHSSLGQTSSHVSTIQLDASLNPTKVQHLLCLRPVPCCCVCSTLCTMSTPHKCASLCWTQNFSSPPKIKFTSHNPTTTHVWGQFYAAQAPPTNMFARSCDAAACVVCCAPCQHATSQPVFAGTNNFTCHHPRIGILAHSTKSSTNHVCGLCYAAARVLSIAPCQHPTNPILFAGTN